MNFIKDTKIKFILIVIIFVQLFYISHHRLTFRAEIIKNSFLENFGSRYIMTNDLLELKKISNNFKLKKFNLSEKLKKNAFFNQRSIEYLYPTKFDKNFEKVFYSVNEKIPLNCTIMNKFEYLILTKC